MAHKHPGMSPEDRRAIAGLTSRHAAAVEHYLAGRVETALPPLEQIVFGCGTRSRSGRRWRAATR